jgi:hypothetical protein
MEKNLRALVEERDSKPIPDSVELALRWTVREAVECCGSHIPKKKVKIPGLSASLESPREKFGAFGALVAPSTVSEAIDPQRLLHGFARIIGKGREINAYRGCLFVPVYTRDNLEWRASVLEPFLPTIERIPCRRSPVLEPFKVRVVSMGRAADYQRVHAWQKAFWKVCRAVPALRLVGEPIRPFHVHQVLNFAISAGLDWCPVSGDYEAATDNLDPEVSEIVLDELCRQLGVPYEERVLLFRALTGHVIEGRPQRWGQLMGSPISFPILCLANLGINRLTQEILGMPRVHLSEYLGCRVNGDDVFLTLPVSGYGFWKRMVSLVGLTPSPGKNYVCPDLAVMNSDLFSIKRFPHHCEVERIPTLRLNLLRVTQTAGCERRRFLFREDEVLAHGKSLKGRAEELIRGWDDGMQVYLMRKFIRYARPILDTLPPVSWWLPVRRGGLGLPRVSSVRPEGLGMHHLRLAAWLACLDPVSARENLQLQWIREPGTAFTARTHKDLLEVAIRAGSRVVLLDREEIDQWSKLTMRLVSWNLSYGPDDSQVFPHSALKEWRRWYKRVIKQSQKTRTSLHAMSGAKALLEPKEIPGYELIKIV